MEEKEQLRLRLMQNLVAEDSAKRNELHAMMDKLSRGKSVDFGKMTEIQGYLQGLRYAMELILPDSK